MKSSTNEKRIPSSASISMRVSAAQICLCVHTDRKRRMRVYCVPAMEYISMCVSGMENDAGDSPVAGGVECWKESQY